jgi:hypothetical protein
VKSNQFSYSFAFLLASKWIGLMLVGVMTTTYTEKTAGETATAGADAAAITHTQGPWKVSKDVVDSDGTINIYVSTDAPNVNGFAPSHARSIAKMTGSAYHNPKKASFYKPSSLIETRSNARLIAAAPELLARCKAAVRMIDALEKQRPQIVALLSGDTTVGNTRAELRAAIANAEGRAE